MFRFRGLRLPFGRVKDPDGQPGKIKDQKRTAGQNPSASMPGDAPLWLIVGLGNPGRQYVHAWHNSGFMVLDRLAARNRLPIDRARFSGLTGKGSIADKNVLLLKPLTYMNRSGQAVAEAARYYRVPPERIVVVYDDQDLPRGQIRIRAGGGPGTHNGMKSLTESVGMDFARVRVGIGPKPPGWDLADFVLSAIPPAERPGFIMQADTAAAAIEMILRDGIETAMNRFNRKNSTETAP